MITLDMVIKIILSILYVFAFFSQYYKLTCFFSILLIIYCNDILTIKEDIFFLIIGFFLAPIITYLTYLLIYYRKLNLFSYYKNLKIYLSLNNITSVVLEELVWRNIIINNIICKITFNKNFYLNNIIIFILILITIILFVFAHRQKGYRKNFEMLIYTSALCLTSIIYPFLNLGLHLGRNNYIKYKERLYAWK